MAGADQNPKDTAADVEAARRDTAADVEAARVDTADALAQSNAAEARETARVLEAERVKLAAAVARELSASLRTFRTEVRIMYVVAIILAIVAVAAST